MLVVGWLDPGRALPCRDQALLRASGSHDAVKAASAAEGESLEKIKSAVGDESKTASGETTSSPSSTVDEPVTVSFARYLKAIEAQEQKEKASLRFKEIGRLMSGDKKGEIAVVMAEGQILQGECLPFRCAEPKP